ncbi:P-loop containing nucleoside triphosphate hydrolase protein [Cytidiella melzeri]|nr:P-loop containing nucleoside triphosphate hydrolase protein [Cytidiella melzeri]
MSLTRLRATTFWRPRYSLRQLASSRGIRTQAQFEYSLRDDGDTGAAFEPPTSVATPRQLVQYLDEFVVGQENAKKVLSVAVFNHYNRVRANFAAMVEEEPNVGWPTSEDSYSGVAAARLHPHPRRMNAPHMPLQSRHPIPLFEKSNVLVIGPTGSGKTLLAKTLAQVLDVPFSVSDATSFTQAGYVGDDVETCVQRLLQAANWDPYRASMGIVYIDEVDKIARKSGNSGTESTRDVGGEGVQQSLLRMMEGSVITVQAKGATAEAPPVSSEGRARNGPQRSLNMAPRPDSYSIDTSNVLFILSGAFVGLDNVIKRRVAKGSIGFTAPLNASSVEESSNQFMPFFTPNKNQNPHALELVEPGDLVRYGFIPEFVSRLPSITTLAPLTPKDLRRVLTEVRGSLISQYTALFGYSGVEIRFSTGALYAICLKAAERGGGARGLRGIMESILLDPMYEVPGSNVRHVLITEGVVKGLQAPKYWRKGEATSFWAAWAEEEKRSS